MKRLLSVIVALLILVTSSPSFSADSRFHNVRSTPRAIEQSKPRVVYNFVGLSRAQYTLAQWGQTLAGAGTMQFGGDVDGGAWFSATSTSGGTDRAYTTAAFTGQVGETWILSYTVASKSGTMVNNNTGLVGGCVADNSDYNNPALGRNGQVFFIKTGGSCLIRMGIGISGATPNATSIRFEKVQLERVPSTRTYPYEYVHPGDTRVFNYNYTASLSGGYVGLVQNEVLGTPYPIHYSHSVLIVGDSICNGEQTFGWGGDYPSHARRHLLLSQFDQFAISQRCVAGTELPAITSSIDTAFAETTYTAGVVPWTAIAIGGGINDVIGGASLATMQSRLVSAIAKVRLYKARPILVTIGPYNAASGAQQTIITSYNTWIKTLGLPVLDQNIICNDGADDFAARCNSADGIHPGTAFNEGSYLVGRALADLLPLLH